MKFSVGSKALVIIFAASSLAAACWLAGCGGECAHDWGDGEVTVSPTCTERGEKTFTCSACGQSYAEEVPATGHSQSEEWTADALGHYHICNNCGEAMDERTAHTFADGQTVVSPTVFGAGLVRVECTECGYETFREIAPAEHMSLSGEFSLSVNAGEWQYGKADYIWAEEDFSFTRAAALNGDGSGWLADGAEIKSDWIKVGGAMTAIALTSSAQADFNVALSFTGDSAQTNVSLRTGIKNREGEKYADPAFEGVGSAISVDKRYSLGKGDTLYFLFNNDGDAAFASGRLSIVVSQPSHEHSWDDGSVIREATCTAEGVRLFTCSDCGGVRTESVAKLEHNYSDEWVNTDAEGHYHMCTLCEEAHDGIVAHTFADGEMITPPSPAGDGVQQIYCTVCGYESTKTVPYEHTHDYSTAGEISRLPTFTQEGEQKYFCSCGEHITRPLPAVSSESFKDYFTTSAQDGEWKYGRADAYDYGTNTFNFVQATQLNGDGTGWLVGNSEIKSDWINAGDMTAISFTAGKAMTANVYVGFAGGTAKTNLSLRMVLNGQVYFVSGNTIDVAKSYNLEEGDTLYFIFGNEAWSDPEAYPNGNLSITVSQATVHDMSQEFSTDGQDGAWKYGKADAYDYGANTFNFVQATQLNGDGTGWLVGGSEIKSDWINAGEMTVVSYTADRDMSLVADVNFVGGTAKTNLSLRIVLNGQVYFVSGNTISATKAYNLTEGDTLYFIFGNEAWSDPEAYPNGNLALSLSVSEG